MGKRGRWMQAVQARLEGVSATQNLGLVLEDAALTEAHELAQTLTDDSGSIQAQYLLGWLHWYRYQALPAGRDQLDLGTSVVMFTPCFVAGVDGLPEPLLPVLADQAFPVAVELLELTERSADRGLLSTTVDLWGRILAATSVDDPKRAVILSNVGDTLLTWALRTGAGSDLDAAISYLRDAVQATPADHPDPGRVSNLGVALRTRFERTGALADLDASVQAGQQAVQATPADSPHRHGYLSNLVTALRKRFERTRAQADLDAVIEAGQQTVQTTPADHPDRASILSNHAGMLMAQFERTETGTDLDAAITYLDEAVRATPADHPHRATYLSNLRTALEMRFQRTGAEADLDAIITHLGQIVEVIPSNHHDRAEHLYYLGNALHTRFERTGAEADVDAVVQAWQQAVQATPADDRFYIPRLSNLSGALTDRYCCTGSEADLDTAIIHVRQAVRATPAGHPDRVTYLSNLSSKLVDRFEQRGDEADINAAVEAGLQAVQTTPPNHPDRARHLSNLGSALRTRYRRTGSEADLDAAITHLSEAIQTPADPPDDSACLSNLGNALVARFERTGAEADLDTAISHISQAIQIAPVNHPARATCQSALSNALRIRFDRTGAEADLDAASEAGQQAVQATPVNHPDRASYLTNFGNALLARYGRTEAEADLDAAIARFGEVVKVVPVNHHDRAVYLSNLGIALLFRFGHTRAEADINAAISNLGEAVQLTPASQPYHAGYVSNLGRALLDRFELTGAEADLDAAIEATREAVQVSPADHPYRVECLSTLGDALQARFERVGGAEDRDAALEKFTEVASVDVASASRRISAGRSGALLVAAVDPGRAAGLLEAAVLLLPKVAPRFLERGDQQYAIGRFAGLGADAAALALSDQTVPESQRPARALRLLEAARGVLLSQALSTRGDLSTLRDRHPQLAARFVELRDWLDRPSWIAGVDLFRVPSDESADALRHTITDRRQASEEFSHLLARIRNLEGFATFAQPPSIEQLEAQAEQGPVVVFNVSSYRSDALLLTGHGITSRRLPGLDQTAVTDQVTAFSQALDTINSSASPLERANAQKTLQQVLAWLWDKAAGPVLDALGYREQPLPGKPWPRLWWVPGGLLSVLPIHAAGHHTDPPGPGRRTVLDRVISSYTPTIGALAHARTTHAAPPSGEVIRSLIVAMPTTPDLPGGELAYVPAEAALLQARLPHPVMLGEFPSARGTAGQLPTKDAVFAHLPGSAIAHFACHGFTDPADPSQSRLLLHDHRRDPLTVAALAQVALDHAQLAYLSACATARVTDDRLLDEAIHLASAFELAGFPHVVGTLWEIDDAVAVEIADAFYTALANPDGKFTPDYAADALHHAIRAQRDLRPANPYLWASHIHAGA